MVRKELSGGRTFIINDNGVQIIIIGEAIYLTYTDNSMYQYRATIYKDTVLSKDIDIYKLTGADVAELEDNLY